MFVEGFIDYSDATILIALQETLAFVDMSLAVKAGVQWGLFAGSVASLGTIYLLIHHHVCTQLTYTLLIPQVLSRI